MEDYIVFVWALFCMVFAIGLIVWKFSRARAMLDQWAAMNGYQVIEARYSWLRGPFFWTSSKGQLVYRITVRDSEGRLRQGWARCGSYWWGLLGDKVEVRWET